jgi:RsiW-degrading membrane proteinase PrsW (M82 family)
MSELFKDPKTLLYAIFGGAIPAIFWLWFWLKEEDEDHTEPRGLIVLSFILGGIIVMVAVWMEKYSLSYISNNTYQVVAWAAIEEILKLVGVMVILGSSSVVRKPIDYPMYCIAVALGFAAFENVLYLLHPVYVDGAVVGLLTGNLRFLGSTLLHLIASAMIGSALGLSFYIRQHRAIYMVVGVVCAVVLHSTFNFFIMKGSGENFLSVFGLLWVVAIINILIFEKLKRMGSYLIPAADTSEL